MSDAIEITGLTKVYKKTKALAGVDLRFEKRKLLTVIGKTAWAKQQ